MKTRSISTFEYNFRTPGSQVEGPIRFAVGQTALDTVLVGRSPRGICAIFLGDDAQALRDQLAAEFPGIELQADPVALEHEITQVIRLIDHGAPAGVIHLDIGGTAFQQRVWQALCGIPAGRTRSYSNIARDLGTPGASRAVAAACAANVLAVAIPCHRAVRSSGSMAGYRWGVARKSALLTNEAVKSMEQTV